MKRFKNILYVTDYREEECGALREACVLAGENSAKLTIASVMPDLPRSLPEDRLNQLRDDLQSVEQHRQGFVFSDVLAPFQAEGLTIGHRMLSGIPFIEMIREVLREKHDLIVVPSTPLFANGRGFSSMVMHLMRKAPCPVWAIRIHHRTPFKHVLAAIDVRDGGSQDEGLNDDILSIAISQAERDKANISAVHAWRVRGEKLLRGPLVKFPEEEWQALHEATRNMHRDNFESTLKEHAGSERVLKTHLIEGLPTEVIPSCADELGADLLIMGTLSHGGIEGYFMGHTSEEILQRTSCSVLAVKPASFTSPIAAVPAGHKVAAPLTDSGA